MARTKANQILPLAANINQKVLQDSSDSSERPLNYNESWSGGQTPAAFSTVSDNLISSVPARLCQIQCLTATGVVTVAVYDQATGVHTSGLVYGPVQMVAGGQVRPMIQTSLGVNIVIAGTGTFNATLE